MAQKKMIPSEKVKTALVIPLAEAKERISAQIDRGNDLLNTQIANKEQLDQAINNYYSWDEFITELLKQIFNTDEVAKNFIGISMGSLGGHAPNFHVEIENFRIDVGHKLRRLQSIYDKLVLYPLIVTEQPRDPNPIKMVEQLAQRFHLVARQLRQRYKDRATLDVSDEYDVQNLLHALLKIFFDDIRAEEWTPSYAGGASRMDFLLKAEQVVVETKKTRKGLSEREIGSQLLEDIARYRVHPDCRSLICFVYDPDGYIGNPRGLETDLSRTANGMTVKVIVAPK